MDTFDAIESRRAVKHYDPNHRLSDDQQRELLGAAMLSPTSFNIQNWRFVLITDQAVPSSLVAITELFSITCFQSAG